NAVHSDLSTPLRSGLAPGAFRARVIGVGKTCSQRIAEEFGDVNARATGIRFGDDQAAQGISGTAEKSAMAEGVIARVSTEDGGNYRFGEIVSDGLIGKRTHIVYPVSRGSLVDLGV